jgi:hypothetical protein
MGRMINEEGRAFMCCDEETQRLLKTPGATVWLVGAYGKWEKAAAKLSFYSHLTYKAELPEEPEAIAWTSETAPFPLGLRKKGWTKGCVEHFNIRTYHAQSCEAVANGNPYYTISFKDLADPDCEWEQRDGSRPCNFKEVK